MSNIKLGEQPTAPTGDNRELPSNRIYQHLVAILDQAKEQGVKIKGVVIHVATYSDDDGHNPVGTVLEGSFTSDDALSMIDALQSNFNKLPDYNEKVLERYTGASDEMLEFVKDLHSPVQ